MNDLKDDFSDFAEPMKREFTVGRGELPLALLTYPAALLYTWFFWNSGNRIASSIIVSLFTLFFLAAGEVLNRRKRASAESWIWMGGTILLLAAIVFREGRVWEGFELVFLHAFATYWLMSRSGHLARFDTSGFVWFDAFNAVVRIPLRNLALRAKIVWHSLALGARGKTAVWTLGAAAAGIALFAFALWQLSGADDGFARILEGISGWLYEDGTEDFFFRLALSVPIGAYLTGMFLGMNRARYDEFSEGADRISGGMGKLKRVPSAAWTAIIAAFCVLYAAFFAVQGSYLFGAFAGRLPAAFTVAEYARQGFFELCRVMAVNFSLLWLAKRCASDRPSRPILTILMAESVLLAATAMSKLGMYIGIFGFTPLRLQSSWLVIALLAGCVCAIVSVWTGRKTFRAWLIFSAAALVLTCFY